MAKRDVKWEDSGFDCDHCGGEILRPAYQTVPEKEQYFQCSQCGCRWSVAGEILRVGSSPHCAHLEAQRPSWLHDKRLWVVGAALFLLFLYRFGLTALFTIMRYLIPLAVFILVGLLIYRIGRQQGLWR